MSAALQKAIVARLRSDAGVEAIVDDRIYDNVPPDPAFPYLSLGPEQSLPDRASCGYDGSDITLQIDAWSRQPGFAEAKRAAEAVRRALIDAPLELDGHRLVDIALESISTVRDPDGLTSHAVVTMRALTEPI